MRSTTNPCGLIGRAGGFVLFFLSSPVSVFLPSRDKRESKNLGGCRLVRHLPSLSLERGRENASPPPPGRRYKNRPGKGGFMKRIVRRVVIIETPVSTIIVDTEKNTIEEKKKPKPTNKN
jgi:hypothetical protein